MRDTRLRRLFLFAGGVGVWFGLVWIVCLFGGWVVS